MDQTVHDRGDDIGYQKREWVIQRIGWAVMALIILAALLGLLGNSGPFAHARLRAPDGSLEVSYSRMQHHHAPATLVLTVSPDMVQNDEVHLWIDADYAGSLTIESIIPEPESVEIGPDRVIYTFTVEAADAPVDIVFQYQHDGYWWKQGQMGIEDGGSVELRQFIFP